MNVIMQRYLQVDTQIYHLVHNHVSENRKNGEHHVVYRRDHSRIERVQSLEQFNKR